MKQILIIWWWSKVGTHLANKLSSDENYECHITHNQKDKQELNNREYALNLLSNESIEQFCNSVKEITFDAIICLRKRWLTHSTHPILNINHIFSLFH